MTNQIEQTFNFDGTSVRTAGTPERPLFRASDVCDALGIADPSSACRKLDQDEQELIRIEYGSGSKHATFVTESGLYALIVRSNKPEAKAFRKWVTSEVLPSIRKTGQYIEAALQPARTLAEQLLDQARALVDQERRTAALEQEHYETRKLALLAEQDNRLSAHMIGVVRDESLRGRDRMDLLEERIRELETKAKIDRETQVILDSPEDTLAVGAFANIHKLRLRENDGPRLGIAATKLSKEKRVPYKRIYDPRWGRVNIYRRDILETVFRELDYRF